MKMKITDTLLTIDSNLGRIATALEKLVEQHDHYDTAHLAAIQDEIEELLPPPRNLDAELEVTSRLGVFSDMEPEPGQPPMGIARSGNRKLLTPEEASKFRKWARDNYQPREEINPDWHQVVRWECDNINDELDEDGQVK